MNLPNKLSMLRILAIPVMAAVYIIGFKYSEIVLTALFITAALTDFLDGYIARKYNMVTDLGKLLDPVADKLLVLFGLFYIVEESILPFKIGAVCGIIIEGRELLIGIMRQIAASKGKIVHANIYGKLKTIFQDIALPMLIFYPFLASLEGIDLLFSVYKYAAFSIFGLSVLLSVVSLIIYLKANSFVFKSK